MSRFVVASLVKDEMGRFFPQALKSWQKFAHEIVVLDDGSTDGTREHAEATEGVTVYTRDDVAAWGNEAPARKMLFEKAWGIARIDDYIFVLDADMTPANDPSLLAETGADGILFTLYDLWGLDPMVYREDHFWRGHHFPRLWAVKKRKMEEGWTWNRRGIHCGHFPDGFACDSFAYAPPEHGLLHYAYATPELRDDKYVAYASVSSDLTDFERQHAISIRDESPHVVPITFPTPLAF